jgi:hypothetical protein
MGRLYSPSIRRASRCAYLPFPSLTCRPPLQARPQRLCLMRDAKAQARDIRPCAEVGIRNPPSPLASQAVKSSRGPAGSCRSRYSAGGGYPLSSLVQRHI